MIGWRHREKGNNKDDQEGELEWKMKGKPALRFRCSPLDKESPGGRYWRLPIFSDMTPYTIVLMVKSARE